MKLLDTQQLVKLDDGKLVAAISEIKQSLLEVRMQHLQEQLKDISLLKKYRRYLARLEGERRARMAKRVIESLSVSGEQAAA
jgi:ribosomal protein L29